jgi:hypothetical protein
MAVDIGIGATRNRALPALVFPTISTLYSTGMRVFDNFSRCTMRGRKAEGGNIAVGMPIL